MKKFLSKCWYVLKYPAIILLLVIILTASWTLWDRNADSTTVFYYHTWQWFQVFYYAICLLVILLLVRLEGGFKDQLNLKYLPKEKIFIYVLLGIAMALVYRYAIWLPLYYGEFPLFFDRESIDIHDIGFNTEWVIRTILIVPVLTEVISRGIILKRLRTVAKPSVAMVLYLLMMIAYPLVVAAISYYRHAEFLQNVTFDIMPIVCTLFFAIIYALVYIWSGNLWTTIIAGVAFELTLYLGSNLFDYIIAGSMNSYSAFVLISIGILIAIMMHLYKRERISLSAEECEN